MFRSGVRAYTSPRSQARCELADLGQIFAAVGGLGTAAFGLVDATKGLGGGINHVGFKGIRNTVSRLTPASPTSNAMSQDKILATLQANWFNGIDIGSQKAIAKSLIKLNLSPANASALAAETGVDADALKTVAAKIAAGTALTQSESDVLARFDFIVTALLDETYQRSDQQYRNATRALAMAIAILLSLAGAYTLKTGNYLEALLIGILATPLAPIAKDLSTALATAVNAMQVIKK